MYTKEQVKAGILGLCTPDSQDLRTAISYELLLTATPAVATEPAVREILDRAETIRAYVIEDPTNHVHFGSFYDPQGPEPQCDVYIVGNHDLSLLGGFDETGKAYLLPNQVPSEELLTLVGQVDENLKRAMA